MDYTIFIVQNKTKKQFLHEFNTLCEFGFLRYVFTITREIMLEMEFL